MIYKLYNSDSKTLQSLPETGMGYQVVEAKQYNRTQLRKFIVYNSELVIDDDIELKGYQRRVINDGFSNTLKNSPELMLETNSIRVLKEIEVKQHFKSLSESKKSNKKRQSGGKGATDSAKEFAKGSEVFVRISAYEDDKRIDFENKKLKPGSFTTTEQDYKDCVSTSDDPIDRYALPNDETIKWAFYIKPISLDILQRGIVQPAFDHEGGGIEVYFEYGTSNDTYYQKKSYGQ